MLGFDYLEQALDKCHKFSDNYPPYNIEQHGDNLLIIKLAVAGFLEKDLKIIQEDNYLNIIGSITSKDKAEEDKVYIYKGISCRKFNKTFMLADGVEPVTSYLENGLLIIELKKDRIQKEVKIIAIKGNNKD